MKLDAIRKCYGKKLNGTWEWEVIVWVNKGMFADFTIKSRIEKNLTTQEEAISDMNRCMKALGISTRKKSV